MFPTVLAVLDGEADGGSSFSQIAADTRATSGPIVADKV